MESNTKSSEGNQQDPSVSTKSSEFTQKSKNESDSEESDYDFEAEKQSVFLNGKKNTYFEEHDFKWNDKDGLVFTNDAILKKQRGVLTDLIKQVGHNAKNGVSILQISLPIRLFQPRSFLELQAQLFKMAPVYLERAAEIPQDSFENALERFKLIVIYAVSQKQHTVQMRKPFNPILGETLQCKIGNYRLAMEQICHHPPISSFNFWGKHNSKFRMYGSQEYRPRMGANSGGGIGYGPFIIEFAEDDLVEIWSPYTEISGLVYGPRTFGIYDSMRIIDRKNDLYADILFQPFRKTGIKSFFGFGNKLEKGADPRQDYFEGVISRKNKINYKENRKNLIKGKDYTHFIHGHWTQDLFIDDEKLWHIDDCTGFPIRPVKNPLQSDCQFREDREYLQLEDENLAQLWKEILEQKQRGDRKLREEARKKRIQSGKEKEEEERNENELETPPHRKEQLDQQDQDEHEQN